MLHLADLKNLFCFSSIMSKIIWGHNNNYIMLQVRGRSEKQINQPTQKEIENALRKALFFTVAKS